MKQVKHQLATKEYYIPDWPVKHLFLGTFNPEGGEKVNYYYGRARNKFWPLLRELTEAKFQLNNTQEFFAELKHHGIACMDMIDTVNVPEERLGKVLGKGYSDATIINGYTEREYNTKAIQKLIGSNPGIKVYSTWGKGQQLMEWKGEIAKVEGLIPLVSPSMAAWVPKGTDKFEFMLADWESKIKFE
ncbi:hypothetical protein [Owenweeksia hongkongensis]|uniref:hypothetical protein n=1 Tax=Owenweeksia hongkongensis TaxID=253245 RepID=UPI003A91E9E2